VTALEGIFSSPVGKLILCAVSMVGSVVADVR
jgi:hypothetical protein